MNARYLVSAGAGIAIGALMMMFVVPQRTSAEESLQSTPTAMVSAARPVAATHAVSAPRAAYAPVSSRSVAARRVDSGRSWKKTALVIGGSAGTGAGVGAIAGGKKGALIGAAIGGGAASLFEAIKRR